MLKRALIAAFALAAPPIAAPALAAEALSLSAVQLRDWVPMGEFRGYTRTMRGFENHIWRFAPDGSVNGNYEWRRACNTFRGGDDCREDGQVTGRWRLEGDRLCVDLIAGADPMAGCFTVIPTGYNHVRLVGPETWFGTLDRQ